MPLYPLSCPECDLNEDYMLPVENPEPVPCEGCGFLLIRRDHQNYQAKAINYQGENIPGGTQYSGYDVGLGCHIRSKQHQEQVMKEQGKVRFVPNHIAENSRDTVRHIRKHSRPGDQEAAMAIRKEQKEADYKRRRTATERVFSNVTPDALQ